MKVVGNKERNMLSIIWLNTIVKNAQRFTQYFRECRRTSRLVKSKFQSAAERRKKHDCKEFRCTKREFCIATDLVCDGVNHCGDDSDEASFPKCSRNDAGTMFGMSMTLFVVAIVSGILIVCSFIVGVSICVCRRPPLHHQTTNFPPMCPPAKRMNGLCSLSLLSDHWEIRGLESFEMAAEEGRAAESARHNDKSMEWKLSIFFMLDQRHSGAV
ncbi:unnamed protein product, partial [Nesidiocoris tenuis]